MCSVIFIIIITVWMFYNQNRYDLPKLVIKADVLCTCFIIMMTTTIIIIIIIIIKIIMIITTTTVTIAI